MTDAQIDVRELGSAGVFGTRVEGGAVAPVGARHVPEARDATSPRAWAMRGVRVLRNAAVAVAVMALVPVGLVMSRGDRLASMTAYVDMSSPARAATIASLRQFALPKDPSIAPMQAGLAYNRLQSEREAAAGFPVIDPGPRPERPWRTHPAAPDLFPSARPDLVTGLANGSVLEAAGKGFTPREMEHLRALATAPIWRDVDLVARARAVDILGGQFVTPFRPEADAYALPLGRLSDMKELAHASVARAAYHIALGQRDSAEAALRSVVSLGLAMLDNSTTGIGAFTGNVVIGVGRDALQRFYALEHDPRATLPILSTERWREVMRPHASRPNLFTAADAHRVTLARLAQPGLPLGREFDALRGLTLSSCSNTRALLFGPDAETRDAFARARTTVARFPSERAYVDLVARLPGPLPEGRALDPLQSVAVSAATVAGVVLQNPRLASCAAILTGW